MNKLCDKNAILSNVRRICGQVEGIEKMINEDREVSDVLQQISAASAALKAVSKQLLQDYANGCFGKSSKLGQQELKKLIEQMFKTL
jgi:DNA-binding FrmR family transcriptional regulator